MIKAKGQTAIAFMVMFPIFIAIMYVVVDFGRFMILQSQAKIYCDSMALSAVGAWDLGEFQDNYNVALNEEFAVHRAEQVLEQGQAAEEQDWMVFTSSYAMSGDQYTAIVTGTAPTLFGTLFGKSGWTTSCESTGKIVVGINEPLN